MHANANNQAWSLALLNDCHRMALTYLRPLLEKLFTNSDLALLEFAEKAQTEASQIRFMEGMSVIRKNRAHIEEVFLREIGRMFSEFGNHGTVFQRQDRIDSDTMTLVSKDETDIQVAIQNMVCSATLGSTHTLRALRKRLAVLNHGLMPEDNEIPAGPHNLAHAFHSAMGDIILEHETRLVVYMLFDRFVLSKARPLYDQYNQHLVKSGILPHLKYQLKKNPHSQAVQDRDGARSHRQAVPAGKQHGNEQSLSDVLFNDILELMSQRSQPADRGWSSQTADGARSAYPPLQPEELLTQIHRLQNASSVNADVQLRSFVQARTPAQQTQLVAAVLERLNEERDRLFRGVDRRRIPSANLRIIDLVGMMFEFMLKDRGIPGIAKAELSRLHTPYLKIAILDNSLFSDTTHPAHVLLNRLAGASARWVFEDNPERGIFPSLRNTVQRIIDDFDDDIGLFAELLENVEATLQNLEEKAVAIEERSRQAEKGKEKLGMARAWAARAIEERIAGHNVPPALRSMLSDVWMDKLTFIYLREPDSEESTSWKLAGQCIETIIWSCEPRRTAKERAELRQRLTDVRKHISLALDTLAVYGNSDNAAQLALIRQLQEQALQEPSQQVDEQQPEKPKQQNVKPQTEPQSDTRETESKGVDRIAGEPVVDDAEAAVTAEEAAALRALENVSFGDWFIIQEDGDTLPRQVKLSWYSSISGKYMFVDSMGVRVMSRRHHELASLLATGKATIIGQQQRPFIHRTLERIRHMLGGGKTVQA